MENEIENEIVMEMEKEVICIDEKIERHVEHFTQTERIQMSSIVLDDRVCIRKSVDHALVQQYADCLDEIEALGNYIVVNQHGYLLDGKHRYLAYQKRFDGKDASIPVYIYKAETDSERLSIAVKLNSTHGKQLSEEDKKRCAISLYSEHKYTLEQIAKLLSVRKEKVSDWTSKIRKAERLRVRETIFDLWLACFTSDQIAKLTEKPEGTIKGIIADGEFRAFPGPKKTKFSLFGDIDDGETPRPLYNDWRFTRNENGSTHFGNTDPRILEWLLYLYTKPFDIVLDPFAGGGTMIDVCRERLRRHWVSDRKPIPERQNEIRLLDIVKDLPPLNNRWSDVRLTFLDPPYWRQAEGKYSDSPEDLGNMDLENFHDNLASIINKIAQHQSSGFIALLMQPTQWASPERRFIDHGFEMMLRADKKRLRLENRISCPLGTQQCTPPMVNWAKANRKLLVLNRELIVWEIQTT
jgi:site-specific DNA-adenine methylase